MCRCVREATESSCAQIHSTAHKHNGTCVSSVRGRWRSHTAALRRKDLLDLSEQTHVTRLLAHKWHINILLWSHHPSLVAIAYWNAKAIGMVIDCTVDWQACRSMNPCKNHWKDKQICIRPVSKCQCWIYCAHNNKVLPSLCDECLYYIDTQTHNAMLV